MSEWYIAVNGQAQGPVSTDVVLEHLDCRDRATVHVWREGFDDWKLAQDVPELRGSSPPPVPLIAVRCPSSPPTQSPVRTSYKVRWFKIGAILGLVYSVLSIAMGNASQEGVFFIIGYISGGAGFAGFTGFISGLLADRISGARTSKSTFSSTHQVVETEIAPGRWNFVARHWRGELPLWVSYWVINFIGNLCGVAVLILIGMLFTSKHGYYPLGIFVALMVSWISILVIACWQLVGTWRSASRYNSVRRQQGRRAIWGGVAQVAVILGVVSTASTVLKNGAPQIIESWSIAFQNDPGIPDYSIRVMRDGTEVEIVGGFKYGLTDDFVKIVGASRGVKIVHLDSIGGRVGEGEKLFEVIRSRGLTTYVSSKCMSACTLAFSGGRERFLRKGAVLGFHKGAFPGVADDDLDDVQSAVFARAGFDRKFITKALSTPNADMFKPEPDVLLAARVITGIAEPGRFAMSGMGTQLSKEDISLAVARVAPVFSAIRDRFPEYYDRFIDEYQQGIVQGKSEAELIERARAKLLPLLVKLAPMASDDVLVDYARLLVEQYEILSRRDPTVCYLHASGAGKTNIQPHMPAEFRARELAVQERVVKTATKRPIVNEKVNEALWDKLFTRLRSNGLSDSDLRILGTSKSIGASKHAQYCSVAIAMFQEISRLSQRDAATLMRTVLQEVSLELSSAR